MNERYSGMQILDALSIEILLSPPKGQNLLMDLTHYTAPHPTTHPLHPSLVPIAPTVNLEYGETLLRIFIPPPPSLNRMGTLPTCLKTACGCLKLTVEM